MRASRALVVLALGLLVAGAVAPFRLSGGGRVYPPLSCSPLNRGPGGTSLVAGLLEREGATVVYGGPGMAGPGVVYLVIGPDLPFSEEEADAIARAVRGGMRLLVADESGNAVGLLRSLGLPGPGGLVESQGRGEWRLVVGIRCADGSTGVTGKAVRLRPGGGRVVCWYSDGSPAAVVYRVGRGLVVVAGDSSVFSNFYVEGGLGDSTLDVARFLLGEAGALGGGIVVFDVTHYSSGEAPGAGQPLAGVAGELGLALSSAWSWLRGAPWHLRVAVALAASAPWPAILLYPVRPREPGGEDLEEASEALRRVAEARLGEA